VGEVFGQNTTTFQDTGLPDATTFHYQVQAIDTVGNLSALSAAVAGSTNDTTPPVPHGNPVAHPTKGSVLITWPAATDNSRTIAYYAISRDNVHIANVTSGTSYRDTKAAPGRQHKWEVWAYDDAGNVSPMRETIPIVTAASIRSISASSVKVVKVGASKTIRYGKTTGGRLVLTFRLTGQLSPAHLNLRVLSGSGKLRVSLPIGTGRTVPGHKIAEKRMRAGSYKVTLRGGMKSGTQRLIVTQTKGELMTIAGKPTLS
jgi:chitodextrinase